MHETILIFAHDPRIGIKESQSLTRIPETVVCAMEFITLPSSPVSISLVLWGLSCGWDGLLFILVRRLWLLKGWSVDGHGKEVCRPFFQQGQAAALDELRRRTISLYPDLKSKTAFWKRRAGVVKVREKLCLLEWAF